MRKQVIEVTSTDRGEPPLYFLGYGDRLDGWAPLWTPNRAKARWFDADEAATEIRLLAAFLEPRCTASVQTVAA